MALLCALLLYVAIAIVMWSIVSATRGDVLARKPHEVATDLFMSAFWPLTIVVLAVFIVLEGV